MRETLVRTSKNTLALFAGTLAKMIASFAFVLFSAAYLGVEEFGKFSLGIFYIEFALSLTSTAVGILLTRDMAKLKHHSSSLLTSASVLAFILTLFATIPMGVACVSLNYSPDVVAAILISMLILVPATQAAVLEATFVAHERAEFVTFGSVGEALIRIPLSVALLIVGFNWLSLMWVMLLTRTMLYLAYWLMARRVYDPRWNFRPRMTRRFFRRWKVFAAENWMATTYANLDVLVLSYFAGEVAVGLYSAAWKVVRLGSVFAKSYTTAVFPVMSAMYGKSRDSFGTLYRQTIRIMSAVALPAVVGITLLADQTIAILYTDEYTDAVPVLRVLIWTLLIEFLNPFLSHALFAQGKQHQSMQVAGISLATNCVLTTLLVSQFGAVGAAFGTVIGGLVAVICYSCFLMPPREQWSTLLVITRVLLATGGLAATLVLTAQQPLPLRILWASCVYGVLLFVVGVVRIKDFIDFKTLVTKQVAS